ncbi:MAG TPA: sigma-54 dependent transcriptional regulator [Thermodesulfovibrionales bacterium]|nr:sigma-54 dependent transcriptional regulator [Thermodesulfovibrionales bacterium]
MPVVLVVDDEPLQRDILKTILSEEGYETLVASSGEEALKIIETYNPEIVLTDLKMEGMDGIQLMENIRAAADAPEVVLMTAFGTVSTAVEAMKKGAYHYLEKPLDKDKILAVVTLALERKELLRKNRELQRALYDRFSIDGIVGRSRAMEDVITVIRKVAHSPVTVLILGESGTGKELVARAIHYNSPRSSKPFTAINCAAIPESLLESELFGYEPGAFTGAMGRKIGLFEATNGGTMFLDEVGDLPAMTQSKILRVLQEKEIRRIGGREAIKADVRIIAATNKDLETEMKSGRFRDDLYYRLRVVAIELPSLRERSGDIRELTNFFLERYNKEFGKRISGVDEGAMTALTEYRWPGNVRQLESVIERAVLMCEADTIKLNDIKSELRLSQQQGPFDFDFPEDGIVFEELEKELLKRAMKKANNVVAKAAKLLGMSYKTFWYRWEKFGLDSSSPKREDSP